MATRGTADLIEFIAKQGAISNHDAVKVISYYRRNKLLIWNAHDGYQIKHGAFYDRDIIRKALAQVTA